MSAKESEKYFNQTIRQTVPVELLNKEIYLDLRIYSDGWFETS